MKIRLLVLQLINIYNNYKNIKNNDNRLFLHDIPQVLKSANIFKNKNIKNVDNNPRLEQLNREKFNYTKGAVNKEVIKENEVFVTRFNATYTDIFLRHAVLTNPKYNDKVKEAYFVSDAYNALLKDEIKVLDHALIGRKLYETENEIVLSFTVLTTKLNKIYYDKVNKNPVNVLKVNDKQGLVKASIIIYLDKNIVDNNILNEKGQKVYNIKSSDILNKLKIVYIEHAKNEGFHISLHEDRANLSFENFVINFIKDNGIKDNGENVLKLKNEEE